MAAQVGTIYHSYFSPTFLHQLSQRHPLAVAFEYEIDTALDIPPVQL